MTDVTKQRDISGFYRYLYREQTKGDSEVKKSAQETQPQNGSPNRCEGNTDNTESNLAKKDSFEESIDSKKRKHEDNVRRRRRSDSYDRDKDRHRRHDHSPSREKRRRERERSNSRDRDRHRSRRHDKHRRSRSRSRGRDRPHRHRSRSRSRHRDRERRDDKIRSDVDKDKSRKADTSTKDTPKEKKVKIIEKENWCDFDVQIERDVKKSFYTKRTVGEVFKEALQRYLQRKQERVVRIYK